MSILRDIFRRRARSILTISGIAVGVFTLVVLGAVAENENVYMSKMVGYYKNVVIITEKNDTNMFGMANGNRPLSIKTVDRLREYPGVGAAFPHVALLLDPKYISAIPPLIMSVAAGETRYEPWKVSQGRLVQSNETGVTMIGPDLAKRLHVGVGDTVTLRGRRFDVVGTMDRTYVNVIDSSAYIPLADAQRLYAASLSEAFRPNVKPEDLVVQIGIYAKAGTDPNTVAAGINRDVTTVHAAGPKAMLQTANGLVALINVVLWTIAGIALLVAGLSIVNTMSMAVSERTREIGVKRALGASRSRIAREVLAEAAVMGGLGGVIGMAAGVVVGFALNAAMVASTGTSLFLPTARLAVGGIVFAVVVGTLSGLYPARYASRLDPAAALAFE